MNNSFSYKEILRWMCFLSRYWIIIFWSIDFIYWSIDFNILHFKEKLNLIFSFWYYSIWKLWIQMIVEFKKVFMWLLDCSLIRLVIHKILKRWSDCCGELRKPSADIVFVQPGTDQPWSSYELRDERNHHYRPIVHYVRLPRRYYLWW